jgi:hypothetical protein
LFGKTGENPALCRNCNLLPKGESQIPNYFNFPEQENVEIYIFARIRSGCVLNFMSISLNVIQPGTNESKPTTIMQGPASNSSFNPDDIIRTRTQTETNKDASSNASVEETKNSIDGCVGCLHEQHCDKTPTAHEANMGTNNQTSSPANLESVSLVGETEKDLFNKKMSVDTQRIIERIKNTSKNDPKLPYYPDIQITPNINSSKAAFSKKSGLAPNRTEPINGKSKLSLEIPVRPKEIAPQGETSREQFIDAQEYKMSGPPMHNEVKISGGKVTDIFITFNGQKASMRELASQNPEMFASQPGGIEGYISSVQTLVDNPSQSLIRSSESQSNGKPQYKSRTRLMGDKLIIENWEQNEKQKELADEKLVPLSAPVTPNPAINREPPLDLKEKEQLNNLFEAASKAESLADTHAENKEIAETPQEETTTFAEKSILEQIFATLKSPQEEKLNRPDKINIDNTLNKTVDVVTSQQAQKEQEDSEVIESEEHVEIPTLSPSPYTSESEIIAAATANEKYYDNVPVTTQESISPLPITAQNSERTKLNIDNELKFEIVNLAEKSFEIPQELSITKTASETKNSADIESIKGETIEPDEAVIEIAEEFAKLSIDNIGIDLDQNYKTSSSSNDSQVNPHLSIASTKSQSQPHISNPTQKTSDPITPIPQKPHPTTPPVPETGPSTINDIQNFSGISLEPIIRSGLKFQEKRVETFDKILDPAENIDSTSPVQELETIKLDFTPVIVYENNIITEEIMGSDTNHGKVKSAIADTVPPLGPIPEITSRKIIAQDTTEKDDINIQSVTILRSLRSESPKNLTLTNHDSDLIKERSALDTPDKLMMIHDTKKLEETVRLLESLRQPGTYKSSSPFQVADEDTNKILPFRTVKNIEEDAQQTYAQAA